MRTKTMHDEAIAKVIHVAIIRDRKGFCDQPHLLGLDISFYKVMKTSYLASYQRSLDESIFAQCRFFFGTD